VQFVASCGVTRSQEIELAGFSRVSIARHVKRGQLQRLARGIYAVPGYLFTEWHDLVEVTKTIPSAVIALISALAFHEIGTQLPYETWIALPEKGHEPKSHLKLRTTRFTEPYYSAGVENHEIEGLNIHVYSAAKTVADCFKMRGKVGYDVAIEALREGWRLRKFTLDELSGFAKLNRVDSVMRPYIEAIIE